MYIHILSLQGPHVCELYTANYPINLNCALSTKLGIPIFNKLLFFVYDKGI